MRDLAAKLLPQKWSDIYGQDRAKNALINSLRNNNPPYAWLIRGPSGVGKGSLVNVYLKALFCKNRKEGEVDPCGKCPSCKSDPREGSDHIIWIQSGKPHRDEDNAATIQSQIKNALNECYEKPRGLAIPAHRNYKVIVVDELQTVPTNSLDSILFALEAPFVLETHRVFWVLMTMNYDGIVNKNLELAEALEGRATPLTLRGFSIDETREFCRTRFPNLSEEIISMVGEYSGGRLRQAVRGIERLHNDLGQSPTVAGAVEVLYYPSKAMRLTLWKIIKNMYSSDNYKRGKDYLSHLLSLTSPLSLLDGLSTDIDDAIFSGYITDHQLRVQQDINFMMRTVSFSDPWHTIKLWRGLDVVDLTQVPDVEVIPGLPKRTEVHYAADPINLFYGG